MPIVLKSGNLKLLEHSGLVQDCIGTASPFTFLPQQLLRDEAGANMATSICDIGYFVRLLEITNRKDAMQKSEKSRRCIHIQDDLRVMNVNVGDGFLVLWNKKIPCT